MGGDKTTTVSSQQQTVKATPEETELNRLALERARAAQQGVLQTQESGLNLSNLLLTGQQLPGNLSGLTGGISPEAIGAQATQLTGQNMANFNSMGLADSGVAFRETSKDIANNLLFPAEQFNIQNLMQLLNQAFGGQAAVQSPIQGSANTLSQSLAGLRSTNTTGSSTQTAMNPFLKSFQQSLGKNLGNPTVSAGPFTFGGGAT